MKTELRAPENTAAETFPAVDILKFIFALLILCLHCGLFSGSVVSLYFEKVIARLAVPFFFVASGFFYGRKVYAGKPLGPMTRAYVRRMAGKLLLFEPFAILVQIAENLFIWDTSVLRALVKVVRNMICYPLGALWYIQAVIVAVILLVPFLKKGKETLALCIGLLLYSFALLCNRYYFLCEGTVVGSLVSVYMQIFISARNGVFVGLMYVSMGVLVAKKWDVLKQKRTEPMLLMLLGSGLCLIMEVYFTNSKAGMDDKSLYVSHILLLPALFLCACRIRSGKNTAIFRNLSTSIYLLHSPVQDLVMYGFSLLLGLQLQAWQLTLATGAILAGICFVVYRNKWNPVYNWVK